MSLDKLKQILEDEEELLEYKKALSERIAEQVASPKPDELERRRQDMLHDIEKRLANGFPVPIDDTIREAGIEAKVRELHRKYSMVNFIRKAIGAP